MPAKVDDVVSDRVVAPESDDAPEVEGVRAGEGVIVGGVAVEADERHRSEAERQPRDEPGAERDGPDQADAKSAVDSSERDRR